MKRESVFDTYNAGYVQAVFEQYLQNPASVDAAWRRLFDADGVAGLLGADRNGRGAAVGEVQLRVARAAGELIDAYRLHGHRAANLDPLGGTPPGHPMLEPEFHAITREELYTVPASILDIEQPGETVGGVFEWLCEVYTGTIGYEYEYLEDPAQREWLREQIESGAHRAPLADGEKRRLLERLTEVESFEQFIHKSYLGAKRFSVEGNDMLVPMLDLAIERAAANGAREIVIGMAHRGRLNVLAHVLGVPYADMIEKFEGRFALLAGTGDVKYHLGAEGTYATRSGEPLSVLLAPNPSHLEFVDPVVLGMTRAKQTDRTTPQLRRDENRVVPILIHGDAAFSAQGVVAETLNLCRLAGYRTGGTLHLIVNNQVGFTTDPRDGRSADYASDLARGFDIPVFHVNADDAEACLAVVRLAMAFRAEFHTDVVIDFIGYRRYGHNEGDEPAYTQPQMYQKIAGHRSVRSIWADRLVESRTIGADDADAMARAAHERLVAEQARVREAGRTEQGDPAFAEHARAAVVETVDTAVPEPLLRSVDRQIHRWPADFQVHPKLARQLERRAGVVEADGPIDWAHAETLALGSLLAQGTPIRMTGQDTQRGTFSQRHLVLHATDAPAEYAPVANLEEATVPIEVHNSPLSELAVLGFEYGYSVVAPRAVVFWEAQFGDFVNAGQIIIDQFMVAGREKWGQESRLVLLLPHGYEGQGPEHSSARIERFLQLAAENNIRVANCTTPAQYFHLLRRQALLEQRRPLVVMTPKSLLRHPRAVSKFADLTAGRLHLVMDDDGVRPASVTRVLLCSGKLYYDLLAAREKQAAGAVALVRVEQLYPFPASEITAVLDRYGTARDVVWAQEEPRNMGAWTFMEPRLRELIERRPATLAYIGRPDRASPAEGYATDHETAQNRIVAEALAAPARKRSRQKAD